MTEKKKIEDRITVKLKSADNDVGWPNKIYFKPK